MSEHILNTPYLSIYQDKTYAISDGGADSCILGKNAKVFQTLEDMQILLDMIQDTRTEKVPIVSAYIKAISSSIGNHPVLLKVHEAPYNANCPITLLSEYQIREYGLSLTQLPRNTSHHLVFKEPNAFMSIQVSS